MGRLVEGVDLLGDPEVGICVGRELLGRVLCGIEDEGQDVGTLEKGFVIDGLNEDGMLLGRVVEGAVLVGLDEVGKIDTSCTYFEGANCSMIESRRFSTNDKSAFGNTNCS